jgi:hypothetical protein
VRTRGCRFEGIFLEPAGLWIQTAKHVGVHTRVPSEPSGVASGSCGKVFGFGRSHSRIITFVDCPWAWVRTARKAAAVVTSRKRDLWIMLACYVDFATAFDHIRPFAMKTCSASVAKKPYASQARAPPPARLAAAGAGYPVGSPASRGLGPMDLRYALPP